jgi:hypothetical protein
MCNGLFLRPYDRIARMPSQLQQESTEVVINWQTDITTSSISTQKVVEDWQCAIVAGAGVHRRL